ncbi:MAG: exosortase-associated EpsI family protein [Chloroflexi bacterium]|nr:exosortase-associated EpsI family protein [Chloroflexota bacterium]
MNFYRQYSLIIGLSVLVVVLALLLSSSDIVFSSGVAFLDADLHGPSVNEVYVETRMDLGNEEHMAAFPLQMGDWVGYDEDTAEWEERLGADVTILRGYTAPGIYRPVHFLVLRSRTSTSFHEPRLCYPAHGYNITEDGKDQVTITHADWVEEFSNISIPLEKLIVEKVTDDGKLERLVVLSVYVKGNQFATDAVTMIRIEKRILDNGSYEDTVNVEKAFLTEAIPLMFVPSEKDGWNPIVSELAGWGIGGYFIIVGLVGIPIGIIVYPRVRYARRPVEDKSYFNQ